jgi:hypothetical protein
VFSLKTSRLLLLLPCRCYKFPTVCTERIGPAILLTERPMPSDVYTGIVSGFGSIAGGVVVFSFLQDKTNNIKLARTNRRCRYFIWVAFTDPGKWLYYHNSVLKTQYFGSNYKEENIILYSLHLLHTIRWFDRLKLYPASNPASVKFRLSRRHVVKTFIHIFIQF